MKRMKRLILSALFALTSAICVIAQNPAQVAVSPAPANEKTGDLRHKTFDIVWRTVKDKHFDPSLGGVDWDRVRQQYEPRAAAARRDQELYRVLQEMLGGLHESHFNIIRPEAVIPDDEKEPGGGIGIGLRMIDGVAVITRVEPTSSAARAGLRPGFVIKQVGEKKVEQIIE